MDYRTIPGTELRASSICLGTAPFGSDLSQDEAWSLLDAFAELGGNIVDTAEVYGAWLPDCDGASERTLGAWMQSRGVRASFHVGTKGDHPDLEAMAVSRVSPAEITHDLYQSLGRLQTDYIDLYWLHEDDPDVPVGELLGVLNEHLSAGRVRRIGASNWTIERHRQAADYAQSHGLVGFCASQIGWSLARANRKPDSSTHEIFMHDARLTYHRESGMPVFAWGSQAGGFFAGKYDRGGKCPRTPRGESVAELYFNEGNFRRLDQARALAVKYGRTSNEMALAYLLSQSFAVYPIVGCHTVEQVHSSCGASDLLLSLEEMAMLES